MTTPAFFAGVDPHKLNKDDIHLTLQQIAQFLQSHWPTDPDFIATAQVYWRNLVSHLPPEKATPI